MNILFQGASVTAQGGDSSYVEQLKNIANIETSKKIYSAGYGGCQIYNAGFLNLEVDCTNIDIFVLEWNTQIFTTSHEEIVKNMVGRLLDKNILPIFLILAHRNNRFIDTASEILIKSLSATYNIPLLDYRNLIDIEIHLRDGVHTNEYGAKIYAEKLAEDLIFNSSLVNRKISPVEYKKLKINKMPDSDLIINESHSLEIYLKNVEKGCFICLETVIGPHSGYVDINHGFERYLFWDRWCHYERSAYITLPSNFIEVNEDLLKIKLSVLNDKVDYSSCNVSLDYQGHKFLKIQNIFTVDCLAFKHQII